METLLQVVIQGPGFLMPASRPGAPLWSCSQKWERAQVQAWRNVEHACHLLSLHWLELSQAEGGLSSNVRLCSWEEKKTANRPLFTSPEKTKNFTGKKIVYFNRKKRKENLANAI